MITKTIRIDPNSFLDKDLTEAAKLIREGKLVAFPTETVYGLGANALDGAACDSVFEAKMRPHDNPLIVHVLSPADFSLYAETENQPLLEELANRFMPGPLTVVLPKKKTIPDSVTVGLSTVALRCPSHPVARSLIRVSGCPIAAPSANLSGRPSPTAASHVIEDMSGRIPMILDGGEAEVGLESTVISLKGDEIHLLRPGFVTAEDLKQITDKVIISPAVLSALEQGVKPESPGMKYRHYAPKSPVTMVFGSEVNVLNFFCQKLSEGCGVLCFDEDVSVLKKLGFEENVISFGSRSDLLSQASGLFDALRKFDSVTVPHIYTRETTRNELGLAISNRLLRACAFNCIEV